MPFGGKRERSLVKWSRRFPRTRNSKSGRRRPELAGAARFSRVDLRSIRIGPVDSRISMTYCADDGNAMHEMPSLFGAPHAAGDEHLDENGRPTILAADDDVRPRRRYRRQTVGYLVSPRLRGVLPGRQQMAVVAGATARIDR
jgi:hypothetical protein